MSRIGRFPYASLASVAACALLACEAPPANVRVVLITIDTLRADRLSGNAAHPSVMPYTLARAKRGARFTSFYVAAPETQPSHASMFTGLPPWKHGVTNNGQSVAGGFETVAETLHAAGFETRAVVASFPVAARFGFDQGFDAFDDAFSFRFFGFEEWGGEAVPEGRFFSIAEDVTDRAVAALASATAARQFFWFHYFDPHSPYGGSVGRNINHNQVFAAVRGGAPREQVIEQVRRLYDADVAYLDRSLERLFRRLDADARRFETHVMVVSDHGESLGEGGAVGHGTRLSDEQLRVPAFILSPRVPAGERTDVAGSVDVAATLLSLAGVSGWGGGGRDLTRPGRGGAAGLRPPPREPPLREWRLDGEGHELPPITFYSVEPDGRLFVGDAEAVTGPDGAAADPELRTHVAERFAGFQAKLGELARGGDLDPEVEAGLRALGYLD